MNVKKIGETIFLALVVMLSLPSNANEKSSIDDKTRNPLFANADKHQISHSSGISFRSKGVENLYSLMGQYSVPRTFFTFSARNNLEFGGMVGKKNRGHRMDCSSDGSSAACTQFNQAMLGISKDVVLFSVHHLYVGVGLGGYLKSKADSDERINSLFTFGEKFFLGYNWGTINTELYVRHFSNASLTNKNSGYNFAGAAVSYNF